MLWTMTGRVCIGCHIFGGLVASDGVHVVTTYNWLSTPSGLRALQALIEQQAYEAEWEEAP